MDRIPGKEREIPPRLLPRGIRIRRGLDSDEFATFEVMRRAMGYDMAWSHHAAMRAHLRNSPDCSFWVAEETPRFGRPRIIGYTRSTVRESVWNLNEFFVLPDHQRRGIGGALLDCSLADGDHAGAKSRYILASQNAGADALYIRRADCIPRIPMLLFAGPLADLRVFTREAQPIVDAVFSRLSAGKPGERQNTLCAEPLLYGPEVAAALDALDRKIIGYARPTEHAHWCQEMGGARGAARLFRQHLPGASQAGPIVGYAYFGTHASGPALALDPANLPRMLAHVVAVQRMLPRTEGEPGFITPQEQFLAVPGTNADLLRWLLDCRWRITFQYLFMSSRPLGSLEHYLCHTPLYTL
jgi:GNAT superfamily N-acetyltransferase